MLVPRMILILTSLFNPFSCSMELFLALLSLGEFHDPRVRRDSKQGPGYSTPSNQNNLLFRLMLGIVACHNSLHLCSLNLLFAIFFENLVTWFG